MLNQSYYDVGAGQYFTSLPVTKNKILDCLYEAKLDILSWNDFEVRVNDSNNFVEPTLLIKPINNFKGSIL